LRLQRQREEADRLLLARGGDDVELAGGRLRVDFLREREKPVGLARHRGGHHHQLVALAGKARDAPRDLADALGASHRGAAVLLDDQGHDSSAGKSRYSIVTPSPFGMKTYLRPQSVALITLAVGVTASVLAWWAV